MFVVVQLVIRPVMGVQETDLTCVTDVSVVMGSRMVFAWVSLGLKVQYFQFINAFINMIFYKCTKLSRQVSIWWF